MHHARFDVRPPVLLAPLALCLVAAAAGAAALAGSGPVRAAAPEAPPGVLLTVERPSSPGSRPGADRTAGRPARFGAAAVLLPDLSGDGVPELAVAAPDQPVPSSDSSPPVGRSGRVHVADGATGELTDVWQAPTPASPDDTSAGGGQFGRRLFVAGDVTGDRYVEVGVEERGRLHLVSLRGRRSAVVTATFTGVARAWPWPDRDGDGRGELLLRRSGQGGLRVVDPGDGRVLSRIEVGGAAVRVVGDVTGDGIPELLDGRILLDPATGRRVVELQIDAAPADAVRLDDLDGDGRPDLAVALSGSVRLVSTGTGRTLARLARPIDVEPGAFPSGLAAADDFDGDGRVDLVVGDLPTGPHAPPDAAGTTTPAGPDESWLHLFSGADGRHLATFATGDLGLPPLTGLLGTTPDRDRDGRRDLLVGGGRRHVTGAGGSELVPGAVLWLSGSLLEP